MNHSAPGGEVGQEEETGLRLAGPGIPPHAAHHGPSVLALDLQCRCLCGTASAPGTPLLLSHRRGLSGRKDTPKLPPSFPGKVSTGASVLSLESGKKL